MQQSAGESGVLRVPARLADRCRAATGGWRPRGRGESGQCGVLGGYPMQQSAGENGLLRVSARLADMCRAATGGRHSHGRGEGDECEDVDANPMNRENVVCPAQVPPVDWRRAATGGRHSHGRCEGDECERLDTNPANRESGVCPAQVWLADRCRAATGDRPAHGRGEGDECERLDTNPVNRESAVCARRRCGWHRAVARGWQLTGWGEGGQCGILGGYPMQQSAAGEVNRVVFRVRVPRCLGTRGLLQCCFCVTQRGRIRGDDSWR
jgi:hypothetical protein